MLGTVIVCFQKQAAEKVKSRLVCKEPGFCGRAEFKLCCSVLHCDATRLAFCVTVCCCVVAWRNSMAIEELRLVL